MEMSMDLSKTKVLILKTFVIKCSNSESNTADYQKNNCGNGSSVSTVIISVGHRAYYCSMYLGKNFSVMVLRGHQCVTYHTPHCTSLCYWWRITQVREQDQLTDHAIYCTQCNMRSEERLSWMLRKEEETFYFIWSKKQTEVLFSLSLLC